MKILIVEDNLTIINGLKFSLEYEKFIVNTTENIRDTKKEIQNNLYDLVILDIMLPDGDGIELCQYIKERQDIPVIFLTAKDSEKNIISGLNVGADDYIVKPFRIGMTLVTIISTLYLKKKLFDINLVETLRKEET